MFKRQVGNTYIFDKDKNIKKATVEEWIKFMEINKENTIIKQEVVNEHLISTVFTGLDHNHHKVGVPLTLETIIFKGAEPIGYCSLYGSWKEAENGHERAVDYVMSLGKEYKRSFNSH